MPDQDKKEEKKLNYVQGYVSEGGYTIDATNIRKRLAKEAYERYTEREEEELQKYAEEEYIAKLYPEEHDEYLVEGAVLTCTMTTKAKKIYRDKEYDVKSPCQTTTLSVTENKVLKCCDLPHATIKDAKKKDDVNNNNIPPFRCNCILAPYTDEEWATLEADETCLTEGTCRALMKLNDEWDNLPQADGEEQQVNDIPLISMGSILFCRHGGIIMAEESGQKRQKVLNSVRDITYENGEKWSDEQIEMAKYVTYRMFLEGYSSDMIAGVVGNIVNEGNFGYFESSYYETYPEDKPQYLKHMDDVHNYGVYVSGKCLSDAGTNILVRFRKEGNCTSELHKFGLGMAQWTGERGELLIDRYLEKFGENAFPTRKECCEIEIDYMLEELCTTYHDVVATCREAAVGVSDLQAVEKNAEIFMKDYEKPSEANLKKRQEAAKIWYDILTGENDET